MRTCEKSVKAVDTSNNSRCDKPGFITRRERDNHQLEKGLRNTDSLVGWPPHGSMVPFVDGRAGLSGGSLAHPLLTQLSCPHCMPYRSIRQRGSWTQEEHANFLEEAACAERIGPPYLGASFVRVSWHRSARTRRNSRKTEETPLRVSVCTLFLKILRGGTSRYKIKR